MGVLAPMAESPRPLKAPIIAWLSGPPGMPVADGAEMAGVLTLVAGSTGAARVRPGPCNACDHACGIDNPPNRCALASCAEIAPAQDLSWPETPPVINCILPSISCETWPNNVSPMFAPLKPPIEPICPIRASCMSMLIGYIANRAGMLARFRADDTDATSVGLVRPRAVMIAVTHDAGVPPVGSEANGAANALAIFVTVLLAAVGAFATAWAAGDPLETSGAAVCVGNAAVVCCEVTA